MRRATFALAAAALASFASPARAQYCPSYTLSSSSNNKGCGVEAVPGKDPTTAQWNDIFDLVAQGPAVWGDKGPSVSDIGQGCGKPEAYHTVPERFPCELLKSIAQAESGWTQFCVPTTPPDQKGGAERTIISFDCGYGIAQVTSGMHKGETPNFDRERVASDPTYNLATGTQILASKWKATQCVGDNQPRVVEHWYTATWAYNGLAYSNNPNNPNYDPNRGVWDPKVGGSAPYQEKVYGRMEHTGDKWPAIQPAYPNPGAIGNENKPPELGEPDCASPTNCSDKRPTHKTACDGEGGAGAGGGGSTGGAGGDPGTGGDGAGAGTSTSTSTSSSSSSSGAGGQDDPQSGAPGVPGNNDGCGCELAGAPANVTAWGLLGLLAAAGLRRRRGA